MFALKNIPDQADRLPAILPPMCFSFISLNFLSLGGVSALGLANGVS